MAKPSNLSFARIALVSKSRELGQLIEVKLLQDVSLQVEYFQTPAEMIANHLEDVNFDLIILEAEEKIWNLLKFFAAVQIKTPLILIKDANPDEENPYPELNIVGTFNLQDFVDQFPQLAIKHLQSLPEATESLRRGYVRIRTEFLAEMSPLVSDVYIQFSGGKMIRVFRKGSKFAQEDVDRYIQRKKLNYLYIEKSNADVLVNHLQTRLSKFVDRRLAQGEEPAEAMALAHEMVHELYQQMGFSPETQSLIKEVLDKAIVEIDKNPKLTAAWKTLSGPQAKFISSHSMLTAQLACAIAAEFKWPSNTTYSKLVYAAFFHDFDLTDDKLAKLEVKKQTQEELQKLPKDVREKIWLHPLNASQSLLKIPGFPQDVDIIIAQHHEKPDGTGFPKSLRGNHISPLAMVFLVAHEFVLHVLNNNGKVDVEAFKASVPELMSHVKCKSYIEVLPKILGAGAAKSTAA